MSHAIAHRPTYDLAALRRHFPALERVHNGQPVAYFDGPGGTQVPRVVAEAMNEYLFHHNANTHWCYPSSHETDAAIADARRAAGDLLNAAPETIVFGANMTTLTFHLARTLGRTWHAGDEVVVTELDHHANIDPWRATARDRDLVVRTVPMRDETGTLDWEAFERMVSSRTRLVAIGAASNALGTINDVARATALAHAHGALVFVDAVHLAPHALVDVQASDADFLACSAYKFHGPHVGLLWGRHDLLAALDVPKVAPAPDNVPDRLETGTLNHEGLVGTMAAIDFLAGLGHGATRRERLAGAYAAIDAHEMAMFGRLWRGLAAIDGVRLFGVAPEEPRTPTVAFAVDGIDADTVATALADLAVFVSSGDFYAATVVERLGYAREGLVRAGCALYTTADEVDRLVTDVAAIASR